MENFDKSDLIAKIKEVRAKSKELSNKIKEANDRTAMIVSCVVIEC